MNDVEVILRLLEHQAFDQGARAHTFGDEVDWPEERALCVVRCETLKAFNAKIRAALPPTATDRPPVDTTQARTMLFLLTEMGG